MRRWPLLVALVACGPTGEWTATDGWSTSITLTPGASEAVLQWTADAGVIVDEEVVDDTDDDGVDDEADLELRVTIDLAATMGGEDGVVRLLWWGESPDEVVPAPEDVAVGADGAERRDRGPWARCDDAGACVEAGELRLDLRAGDEVTVDVDVTVEARANDEDNPIDDGWLVVDGEAR